MIIIFHLFISDYSPRVNRVFLLFLIYISLSLKYLNIIQKNFTIKKDITEIYIIHNLLF